MLERLIDFCRDQLAGQTSLPEYDHDFLQAQNYKHLETFATVTVDDQTHDMIRCNLCGDFFAPSSMGTAVDHVASHSADRAGAVDAFEDASPSYGAVLEMPPDQQSAGVEIAENEPSEDSTEQ